MRHLRTTKGSVETGRKEEADFCLGNSIDYKWKIRGVASAFHKWRERREKDQLSLPNVNYISFPPFSPHEIPIKASLRLHSGKQFLSPLEERAALHPLFGNLGFSLGTMSFQGLF